MKKSMSLMVFCLVVFASVAGAYEYPLQFTPNPGFRGLVVAGYWFEGNVVAGNCSYYTTSGNAGSKGGSSHTATKNYQQTCRWDQFGNLLNVTPGAPTAPSPISIQGTKAIYAVNANGNYTGTDMATPGKGFVSAQGSHYTWLTPNTNGVLQQVAATQVVTLTSDGDVPVNITAVAASALNGISTLKGTTCVGQINVGDTCSVIVTYDPTNLAGPNGLAYDTLRIDLTSDAGDAHDFIQNVTIILPAKGN